MEKTITIVDNQLDADEDKKAREVLRILEGMSVHSIYRVLRVVDANVVVYKTIIAEGSPLLAEI